MHSDVCIICNYSTLCRMANTRSNTRRRGLCSILRTEYVSKFTTFWLATHIYSAVLFKLINMSQLTNVSGLASFQHYRISTGNSFVELSFLVIRRNTFPTLCIGVIVVTNLMMLCMTHCPLSLHKNTFNQLFLTIHKR